MKLFGSVSVILTFCSMTLFCQKRAPTLPETPPPTIPPYVGMGALKGTIETASDGRPLAGAFVYVHSEFGWGGDNVPKLDKEGKFELSLPAGLYDVFVAAGGFIPTCKVVEVDKGTTVVYSPKLEYDFEHSNPD